MMHKKHQLGYKTVAMMVALSALQVPVSLMTTPVQAATDEVAVAASLPTNDLTHLLDDTTVTNEIAAAEATDGVNDATPVAEETANLSADTATSAQPATDDKITVAADATTTSNESASLNTHAATAPADTDLVKIPDANLAAAMCQNFNVAVGTLTYGDIRAVNGNAATIIVQGTDASSAVTSLTGLEALQYLPDNVTDVTLQFNVALPAAAGSSYDFSPILAVKNITSLVIDSPNWGSLDNASLATLMQVPTGPLSYIEMIGAYQSTAPGAANPDYMKSFNGLTNAQLAYLAPWFTEIGNNGSGAIISLSDNQLSDFTPLKNIKNTNVWVVAYGQAVQNTTPLNGVIGQPLTFTADNIIGPDGAAITPANYYSMNGSATGEQTPIDYLGAGRYEIPTAYQLDNANTVSYGYAGLLFTNGAAGSYYDKVYPNNLELKYDARIYQPITWRESPEVTVDYIDSSTGQQLAPASVHGENARIGDTFNMTPAAVTGYTFDPQKSSALNGTYSQDPQTLTFYYAINVETITINYVDSQGKAVANPEMVKGNYGSSYTIAPKEINGYTLLKPTTAVTGTYGTGTNKVTFIYQRQTGQVTVNYVDTSGKKIAAPTIATGDTGTAYHCPAKKISGYTLKANQPPFTGKYTTGNTNLTFTYTRNKMAAKQTTTPRSTTPTISRRPLSATTRITTHTTTMPISSPATSQAAATTTLPQTGENVTREQLWTIIGLLSALALGAWALVRKQRQ